jgi:hypothetical protein
MTSSPHIHYITTFKTGYRGLSGSISNIGKKKTSGGYGEMLYFFFWENTKDLCVFEKVGVSLQASKEMNYIGKVGVMEKCYTWEE